MTGLRAAEEAEFVAMVRVTDAAFDPGVTEAGETLQVEFAGVPEQLSLTALANDPARGVTVSEYVAVAPGLTLSLEGELANAKSTPAPDSVTTCGFPEALSVIVSVPLRLPAVVGVKTIVNVQLEAAARAGGQLLVCEKSPLT